MKSKEKLVVYEDGQARGRLRSPQEDGQGVATFERSPKMAKMAKVTGKPKRYRPSSDHWEAGTARLEAAAHAYAEVSSEDDDAFFRARSELYAAAVALYRGEGGGDA